MIDIPKIFGSMVFSDEVMRERLPKDIYNALKKTMDEGTHLELDVANVVAATMKDWAVEKGATHFTHWFQPMTGITAEKHDSFISPSGDGKVVMEFSGKELISGESDASSFPSGGLRATFEARGYTVWDTTSYAFIKDGTLFIPTAFCSYSGEALDKKTPLLRSMEAVSKQALRILRLFGNGAAKRVIAQVGPEQEYFLIDKEIYAKRQDLIHCGRTLFGAKPPKGQEMEDHYFGSIKPRVAAFMKELDEELWKLGIYARTKHNEVAPAQHELAPIYTTANIATDHNQITMEMMKAVADRHGLVCLLHEKPFAGVSGSGKHNNWSISTDGGANLLEPGHTPHENAQFLLFLVAVVKAVDEYQDVLRLSAASAGNDHRLGGHEAPPNIISIFLGDELTEILEALECGECYENREKEAMQIGVTTLPHFPKDTTDRNRTSPLAFTGNKFEFRMPGSAFSISGPNIVLNTAVADVLSEFAESLEKSQDFNKDLEKIIKQTFKNHKRIVFNGNSYCPEWICEAQRRGLSNFKTTVEAMAEFTSAKSVELFARHGVFTETEIRSRQEILLESYCKTLNIEALTMVEMTKREIIPALVSYQKDLAKLLQQKKGLIVFNPEMEKKILEKISKLSGGMMNKLENLENVMDRCKKDSDAKGLAEFYRDNVVLAMAELRAVVDELETLCAKEHWPLPTYGELLHSVS